MRKFFVVLSMFVVAICLAGCSEQLTSQTKKGESEQRFELNAQRVVLAVGEKYTLSFAGSSGGSIEWSTDNPKVCSVSDNGTVSAEDSGSAKVKASISPRLFAICEVTVAEGVVSADFDSNDNGFGVSKFASVESAAKKCKDIVVMSGEYDEYVVAKEIKLIGVGEVRLRGVSGEKVSVANIGFEDSNIDNVGMIVATDEINLDKCSLTYTGKDREGTIGLSLGDAVRKISVIDSSFSGFGAGISCVMSPAEYHVVGNKLVKCGLGIGVDLRKIGGFGNVEASGQIKANKYSECVKNTEFIVAGEYNGSLDFYDIKEK